MCLDVPAVHWESEVAFWSELTGREPQVGSLPHFVRLVEDGRVRLLLQRLDEQRTLLATLLAEHLPEARMRRLDATYLAWLDLRAYGHHDPAAVCLERGRVRLAPGHDYHPGSTGHVRLNIARTDDAMLDRIAAAIDRVASHPQPPAGT